MQSDKELVESFLRTRDEATFRVLYRRHSAALYGLIKRELGGDSESSNDVLQEVWVRAIRLLPGFQWRSQLRTWLSGVALNCCSETRRRGKPVTDEIAEPEVSSASWDPSVRVDLQSAIQRLAEGYRTVLVMHDVYGFTHEDIARNMGISEGTSRSQLSRAREIVRNWIGERK